jgi:CBS-domain-containing membrane protein
MEFRQAGDFMIPLDMYPHIPYWFTLRQTIAELQSTEVEREGKKSLPRWALVFDEKYQLMGTARRRDILRGLEPEFLTSKPMEVRKNMFNVEIDSNLSELSYDKLIEGMRKQSAKPVSDIMQPIKTTVDYGDHMIKVIYEMVDNNVSMIPVIKDNKVVGVVRSADLLSEVVRIVL